MKKARFIFIVLIVLTTIAFRAYTQTFTLDIQIDKLPGNHIVLGSVSGDDFKMLDTLLVHPVNKSIAVNSKATQYTFPENFQVGMYRLVFGQTTYAKVMDEAPQQLDFIFNNENLIFETDFDAPEDSLLVVLSEENRIWFEFYTEEKGIHKQLKEMEQEIDYYTQKNDTAETAKRIYSFNQLQKMRNNFIAGFIERYPDLLATEMIKMYREPFLDGNLTEEQRKDLFQTEFFNALDFTDERLINSSVYTDRIFYYLTSYNQPELTKEQLENEYIKAVGAVIAHTNQNQKVYKFILGYMIHGFEVLKMDKVIDYITKTGKL